MAITRHLVNMMDGNISVKSEPGKGSVFTVRLQQGFVDNGLLGKELTENLKRYRLGAPERVKKSQQFIREYMPYGRVLVVDDVETNLYVVRGLLAPYGLSVETAESGYNAIDKIRNGSTYDIIFMDHFMPDMDGMEATRIIRSLCYPHPIIALTANAVAGQAEVFLSSGFDGFISKPIDIRQLNTTLIKLIRDKYPADVVEAAQKLRAGLKDNSSTAESQPDFDPKLAEVFIRDAEKAIAVLDLINKYNFRRADDMNMFVINVHAMKSALANIGEAGLSDAALNLEKAGKDGNLAEIADNINLFLDSLKCLLERIRPQDNEGDAPVQADPEDMDFLREKLALIRDACSAFDKKTAKKALADINKKKWPGAIKDKLDDISEHLLHSEFEEAAKVVTDIICKF
jgi:CheY-like chemotaxis protein